MKPNGWKLFHLWPTVLSETQNYPIPIRPFWAKFWNLEPYHLLDIITKEKPAKFQTKRTAGSKVLRLCNFCAPKRVKTRKGPKSVPYWIFLFPRWRYPEIMGTDQILRRNRFKFLHLELTELSVPKLPHLPNPYFRKEIGNSDDGSPQISSRQQSLPNFKSDQHQVSLLQGSILLVPKMGQFPKPTMPRPYPEFYWSLLYLWGIQPSPENLGQIDLANLMWERVEIWDPKFQRAQKRELEPKKIQWWVEGNISRLNFHRKIFCPGLWPNIFDRIQTQAC